VIVSEPNFLHRNLANIVLYPVRTLLIILLALLARALLKRAINRLARSSGESDLPLMLRPLGERVDIEGFLVSAGLRSERRRQRAETIASVLGSITTVVVFGLAGMLILGELGINLAPVVAGASIFGVALAFGAQNLVKDFLSGIFMLLEDQYGVGDVVDVGDVSGSVEAVGLRTTQVRDIYGTVWYIRNGEIARVGNKSQGYAQIVLDTPVPKADDPDRAGVEIKAAADSLWRDPDWSDVVVEEPQLLGIERLTDDGVVLRLVVKTRPLEQWRAGRELRSRVRQRLGRLDRQLEPGEAQTDTATGTPGIRPDGPGIRADGPGSEGESPRAGRSRPPAEPTDRT
jgi:small conductance mechanosensitive channel